jgi:L,D-peptidoglycan transpeptidase YkuD (ErfK/YbiS/YcfS/YnhG family)
VSGKIRVDAQRRILTLDNLQMPCVIGKGDACPAANKREGDGCTPLGFWPVRGALIRPDRIKLTTRLHIPWRWIGTSDGWSDDPRDPAYNRPVTLPHPYSAEQLWRDDAAYDIILVLGHNDAPPVAGSGSAIFFHISVSGADGQPKPTEGCVAITADAMQQLLPLLTSGMVMEIF